ncbi:MAG TPA: coenzyme F420-0:L-glutamate ligase [Candidatus Saccharimonadales bacterium]|nr:coenzyme F420-0:L-glutamate ligase [Candidatus Saccharimonadales bacterium]
MIITPIKTRRVEVNSGTIFDLLDESLTKLKDSTIVTVTSKVVGICEGRVVPVGQIEKSKLIKQEADYVLPPSASKFKYNFSIIRNTLVAAAGIDESNGNGNYVLWPRNPQQTANKIRAYLKKRFGLKKIGVLITDSSSFPLRYGTLVIPIGHSGFLAKNDYRGQPDLFGRKFHVSISSVAGGLAAASGVAMGEGTEQTPIAVIEDLPFVQFQDRNPTKEELDAFYISHFEDDLYFQFLGIAPWKKQK